MSVIMKKGSSPLFKSRIFILFLSISRGKDQPETETGMFSYPKICLTLPTVMQDPRGELEARKFEYYGIVQRRGGVYT